MTEAETKRKFDDIVEFADIGRFLDTPVGHYSSGMFARLGFAVADPRRLPTSSWPTRCSRSGTGRSRRSAWRKMQEIRDSGRTLFYVSHAAGSVRKMCDRVLVLEKGRLGFDGAVDEGIRYLQYDDDTTSDEHAEDDDARRGARRRHLIGRGPATRRRVLAIRTCIPGTSSVADLTSACRLEITAFVVTQNPSVPV